MELHSIYFKKASLFFFASIFSLLACGAEGTSVKFEKKQMTLGGKTITVEIADSEAKRAQGLMYRESLPANSGMLFIFDYPQHLNFWMKNTYIDLAIGFFDENRTLVDIQEMKRTSVMTVNFPSYVSKKPSQYALEMTTKWFTENKVKLGTKFEIKDPPKSRLKN